MFRYCDVDRDAGSCGGARRRRCRVDAPGYCGDAVLCCTGGGGPRAAVRPSAGRVVDDRAVPVSGCAQCGKTATRRGQVAICCNPSVSLRSPLLAAGCDRIGVLAQVMRMTPEQVTIWSLTLPHPRKVARAWQHAAILQCYRHGGPQAPPEQLYGQQGTRKRSTSLDAGRMHGVRLARRGPLHGVRRIAPEGSPPFDRHRPSCAPRPLIGGVRPACALRAGPARQQQLGVSHRGRPLLGRETTPGGAQPRSPTHEKNDQSRGVVEATSKRVVLA